MSLRSFASALALVVALTIFLTWPQALRFASSVANHSDPYFSMWRIGWIAHALRTDPAHLYDGNIYYPETRTLAYSDAMILEGGLGAPFVWLGMSTIAAYNLLLFAGIAGSGLAMFVLAQYLTRRTGAALLAAAIFTLAPYRVEHFMHLELQWTMWIPLAFYAVHRAVDEQAWRFALLAAVAVWLQLLSSVYYAVFLAILLPLHALILMLTTRASRGRAILLLATAGCLAALLALPYVRVYLEVAQRLGPRDLSDVASFSARWMSYLTAPYQNWWWGGTALRFTGEELRVTPGLIATALAAIGCAGTRSRITWTYLVVFGLAVELSLGLNGHLYPWLLAIAPPLRGLRAIARVSIFAIACLAVLAGFGVAWLQDRFSGASVRRREWIAASAIAAVTLECGSIPMRLTEVGTSTPPIYQTLSRLPRGAVVEIPMAEPGWLPGFDPDYEYWSTKHWMPLVNGYSGYASNEFVDTLRKMLTFPDDESVARLKALNVRYVLIHERLFDTRARFTNLILQVAAHPEFKPGGYYQDWTGGNVALFELR